MGIPQEVPIGVELEEFPAGSFNELVRDYYRRRAERAVPPSSRQSSPLGWLLVHVKNASGADRKKGEVLGIDGPVLTFEDDPKQVYVGPVLKGIIPTTADHANSFVILQENIANGKIGSAFLIGCDWAKVDVTNDTHESATVKNNDATCLESATSGAARIVYKEKQEGESGSDLLGIQWAIVVLGGGGGGGDTDIHFGRVTSQIMAAEGWLVADWGEGEVQPIDDIGGESGDPINIKTRFFEDVLVDTPVWYVFIGAQPVLLVPGCAPHSYP